MAGYSATPLAAKLGIKPGMTIAVVGAPGAYADWFDRLPDGVHIQAEPDSETALVHLFARSREAAARRLSGWRRALDPATPVWVSWPKKSSALASDLSEDVIRELALPLGYVDVKVCAVDATWSALKLVVRKALR